MELHCIFISFILIDSLKIKCLLILQSSHKRRNKKKEKILSPSYHFPIQIGSNDRYPGFATRIVFVYI